MSRRVRFFVSFGRISSRRLDWSGVDIRSIPQCAIRQSYPPSPYPNMVKRSSVILDPIVRTMSKIRTVVGHSHWDHRSECHHTNDVTIDRYDAIPFPKLSKPWWKVNCRHMSPVLSIPPTSHRIATMLSWRPVHRPCARRPCPSRRRRRQFQ